VKSEIAEEDKVKRQTVNSISEQNVDGENTGSVSSNAQENLEASNQSDLNPKAVSMLVAASVLMLGGLLVFGALPRFMQQQQLVQHHHKQLAQIPSVSVLVAQNAPPVQEFTLPGSMQAIQDALIYARVSGYLRARYVDIGNQVHAGQTLADIDTPELDKQVQAAESAVEQAKANLDSAKEALGKEKADLHSAEANTRKAKTDLKYFTVEVGRYEQLAGMGAVSLEQRDTRLQAYEAGVSNLDALTATERSAQASVNTANAAVHVAQAALNNAKAQREQVEATRSFKKVTAPFDGIVTQRNVDAGALVTSGSNTTNTVLFEVAKTDTLRIFVYVPEQFVPFIQQGEQTLVNVQEYPGRDFTGTVAHVAGGLDQTSKTLQVEIHIPNADHKLLPGMYARVRFEAPAQNSLTVIPATTVQTRPDGSYVYSLDEQNRVHMHKVEIGRDLGGQFEIARGLQAGQRVIVNPSDELQEGLLVKPVAAPTAAKAD
jgi:RND family efflux transporter MFP subunit